MGKHIWGYWNCPYCDTKGIRADNQSCPSCGAPVLPGTKFYVKDGVREEVEEEKINNEVNWICEYCDAQNDAHDEFCRNCGSPKEEAKRDYFSALAPDPEPAPPPQPANLLARLRNIHIGKKLKIGLIFLFVSVFLIWLFVPITRSSVIESFEWERSIAIEEFQNVDESDWALPQGANLHRTAEEIHHYDQVLDHYETKTRRVAHKVQDGYDTKYKDLGNGQFEEIEVPRYRTEYVDETYEEPVYRSVPVYKTKYYYDIDKWVMVTTANTHGNDHEPYWKDTGLSNTVTDPAYGDRREGEHKGTYYVIFKDKKGKEQKKEYSESEWSILSVGDTVSYKTFRFSNKPL